MIRDDTKLASYVVRKYLNEKGIFESDVSVPEDDPRVPPNAKIDLSVRGEGFLIGLEHTRVGPYVGYEREANVSTVVCEELRQRLSSELSGYNLVVGIPVGWEDAISKKNLISELCSVLPGVIGRLKSEEGDQRSHRHHADSVRGLNVRFTLRPIGLFRESIYIHRILESDIELEKLRLERLSKDIPRKVLKLDAWCQRNGGQKLLLLEDRDLAISNEGLVASAVHAVLQELPVQVDTILYLDAAHEGVWTILPVLEDGVWDDGLYDADELQRWIEIPSL